MSYELFPKPRELALFAIVLMALGFFVGKACSYVTDRVSVEWKDPPREPRGEP